MEEIITTWVMAGMTSGTYQNGAEMMLNLGGEMSRLIHKLVDFKPQFAI